LLDVFLDYFKKLAKSRLFPVTLIYLVLFGVIINRLFVLQIVEGPEITVASELKYAKQRDVKSTRGNIYDRNGVLLATNKLSYSVVMEGVSITSNKEYNAIIDRLVKLIESSGDTLDTEFYITINEKGEFEFTVKGKALTRFLENAYAYVLVDDELTEEQKNSTPQEVFDFLKHGTGNAVAPMFSISDDYSDEEALKIMSVRYALFINYPKYLQVTVASGVSDKTVAAIKENNSDLRGVDIQQQASRVYEDSLYFSHLLGYTGLISSDELEAKELAEKENKDEENTYNSTDMIGKSGLEQVYEQYLSGKKGTETVTVNSNGRVTEIEQTEDPIAGNDLYLTIDSILQKNVYLLLEKEITNILLSSIVPTMSYGSKGESASEITIPIYEVYNALINNNIIDVNEFDSADASTLEKSTKTKYETALRDIDRKYNDMLALDNITTNDKAGDMEDFLDYFYSVLVSNHILLKSSIPENDTTYQSYLGNNISLSAFLQSALANNWIDLSILGIGDEYYSAEELYQKLIDYTKGILKEDNKFQKMIYRNLIFSYKLSGNEICLLLFDQDVLEYNESEINNLRNGNISSYKFITDKIKDLKITPGMLALEPCSGSVVITDVKTGDVLAMVTYPSYDNNLFANKIDSNYYNQLLKDNSYPLLNRAISTRTAPGSTFKMITAVAALEEGVTTPSEKIVDLGQFTKINPAPKCHIYPGSHGAVDIVDALKVSCNYFFFEMGWRLSIDNNGKYDSNLGLTKLQEYATQFGLDETSGLELSELNPQISTQDAVRSSIGQGSNNYTPAQLSKYITTLANRGTCYNLTLLDKIEDKDGTVILDNSATVDHDLTDVRESTWDTVWDGMYAVTNVNGGSVYTDYSNFDVKIAGKTGTAQISKSHANNALFVSFAPYESPKISVTTVIPNGYTSHNAAALTKNIYSLYFKKADANTLLNGNTDGNSSGGALE
jgi:penicillin-binding protein 2